MTLLLRCSNSPACRWWYWMTSSTLGCRRRHRQRPILSLSPTATSQSFDAATETTTTRLGQDQVKQPEQQQSNCNQQQPGLYHQRYKVPTKELSTKTYLLSSWTCFPCCDPLPIQTKTTLRMQFLATMATATVQKNDIKNRNCVAFESTTSSIFRASRRRRRGNSWHFRTLDVRSVPLKQQQQRLSTTTSTANDNDNQKQDDDSSDKDSSEEDSSDKDSSDKDTSSSDDDDDADELHDDDEDDDDDDDDGEEEERWTKRYHELQHHVQSTTIRKRGGNILDTLSPSLQKWLRNQRFQFARWKEDQSSSTMNLQRQEKLDQLGIHWREFNAWSDRYHELEEFVQQHGHCLVPVDYAGGLGLWVKSQQRLYRSYKLGKRIQPRWAMNKQKAEKLERLNIPLDIREARWMRRYEELIDYKERNGNCLVPMHSRDYPELANWVSRQRANYRKLQSSSKTTVGLTEARIRKLEQIGFEWDVRGTLWELKYQELIQYKKQHGHSNVTVEENLSLGTWVSEQRKHYQRRYMKNKNTQDSRSSSSSTGSASSCSMTDDRIHKLNQLDFDWDPLGTTWKIRYQELVKYYEHHGHCLVPRCYNNNPSLAYWVSTQRREYKKMMRSRNSTRSTGVDTTPSTSPMTMERIQLLEKLRFDWDASGNRGKRKEQTLGQQRQIENE